MKKPLSVMEAAITKRIQSLPKLVEGVLEASAKRDADRLEKLFHDGIKKNTLGLTPLKDATISHKEAMGWESPESPLYGLGDEFKEGTYSNMLETVKEDGRRRYIVRPKDGYHYAEKKTGSGAQIVKQKIKLKKLFEIHEYGCTIARGDKLIRIPPRPAFRYAYVKLMSERKKADDARRVRKAIAAYVKSGDERAMQIIAERDV